MTAVPSIELNDGNHIPQLGFGVFQIDPADTAEAVAAALEIGYRHIDTAEMYENEAGVAEGLRASGLARGDVFITSKLSNAAHAPDAARAAFDETLRALGTDYVDLFLIHWPLPMLDEDYVETWRVMEELKRSGRARSIGVSNFQGEHLDRLAAETDVVPAVNQIELHPYLLNAEVDAYGREHGIATEAWSPIAQGAVLDDPEITAIADRLDRTPAQVVLRWHIQRGNIVFPKSSTPARMRENYEIFDFELSREDLGRIDALDRGEDGRTGPHPNRFDHVPA
jgi:2,5-diketo-D-gluconate reductase A